MTEKHRILLLEAIHPVARDALSAEGFEIELLETSLAEEELMQRIQGVHAIGIRSKTQLTARVLEAAEDLLVVGAFCIGTNQIDLDAATHRGLPVFNAPFSNTRSVAELVLSQIVMLSRQLGDRVREMHEGKWRKMVKGAREVRGKVLGIIGYGHIGRQVGVLAEAFGLRVLFYDVLTQLPMGNNQPVGTLNELLEQADFVTLHVPATPQTHMMMGTDQLHRMKKGSFLLNLSRGTVVDIPALAQAIREGHIGGASVDVYPEEPRKNVSDDFRSELQGLSNVVMTPHIGGSTLEAQENIGREVATSLTKYLKVGGTTGSVNFPHVEVPFGPGLHRVVNVHQNVPGVLRDLNRIVSEADANVQAQLLATTPDIGYLVMDLDRPVSTEICANMAKLDTTIRARALW